MPENLRLMNRHTMPTARLAELLGRLAIALSAGIDLRRAWASETDRTLRRWQPAMAEIRDRLASGEPLSQAMRAVGDVFPPLVIGMTEVGEKTGHEPEIFRELSRVLNRRVHTARSLRVSLTWPAFQLGIAILVVGLLIFLAGVLRDAEGNPIDLLGFGLGGTSGVVIYTLLVVAVGTGLWFGLGRALASWQSHGIVRRALSRVPVLGAATRAAEAAGWSRAAGLAAGAGLDAGRLVNLASSVAPGLAVDRDQLVAGLRGGQTLAEALRETGRFPAVLCEGVAVGEMSGTTAEVLGRLADEFDDEARRGLERAAHAAGGVVWLVVAGVFILVIFRIFSSYVGMINALAIDV